MPLFSCRFFGIKYLILGLALLSLFYAVLY